MAGGAPALVLAQGKIAAHGLAAAAAMRQANNCAMRLCYTWQMNRVLKAFVIWLLLLALPVQGYAAAALATRGPGPQQLDVHTSHHMAAAEDDGDGHSGYSGLGHHRAADNTLADHEEAPHHPAGKHASSACGNCGASCTAALMLSNQLNWDLLLAGSILYAPAPPPHLPGVVLAGPERPPRTFLA